MRKLLLYIFLLAGCTAVKPLDYSPAPKQRSADYIENLLAFKAKKSHKVSIAVIESTPGYPTRANQHLTAYPDSLDYIALKGLEPLYSGLATEMDLVRPLGIKVLHVVDYSMAYDSWMEDHLELEEGFLAHLKDYTDRQIASANAYSYDGIIVSYLGKTTSEIEVQAQAQFMEDCRNWVKAHRGAEVIFRGYTRNLADPSFLEGCSYIIFVPGDNSSMGEVNLAVYAQLTEGVPTDRAVLEVAIPDAIDGEKVGPTAELAASWVKEFSDRVTKKGLAFTNAQDDYYHPERIFPEIRDGINLSHRK